MNKVQNNNNNKNNKNNGIFRKKLIEKVNTKTIDLKNRLKIYLKILF